MSELPPPAQSDHDPQTPPRPGLTPLSYATPRLDERPKPRTPFVGRMAIGFFGYLLFTAICVAMGVSSGRGGSEAFALWALMTVALLGLSLYLRIRYRFSGVGVGIILCLVLIPIGLFLLLLAICGHGKGI